MRIIILRSRLFIWGWGFRLLEGLIFGKGGGRGVWVGMGGEGGNDVLDVMVLGIEVFYIEGDFFDSRF